MVRISTLSSSKCIGDLGVSWRKRQRAQSMPSFSYREFHPLIHDDQVRALTIDVPLFRPRTVRSKAWPVAPLTTVEPMMSIYTGVFNDCIKIVCRIASEDQAVFNGSRSPIGDGIVGKPCIRHAFGPILVN